LDYKRDEREKETNNEAHKRNGHGVGTMTTGQKWGTKKSLNGQKKKKKVEDTGSGLYNKNGGGENSKSREPKRKNGRRRKANICAVWKIYGPRQKTDKWGRFER